MDYLKAQKNPSDLYSAQLVLWTKVVMCSLKENSNSIVFQIFQLILGNL